MINYLDYYNLENYLFETVTKKFKKQGYLDATDFFCIIIWKSNRAKTKIAKKLLGGKPNDLNIPCKQLTSAICSAQSPEEKLRVLLKDWKFGLPMASAILTVLYPDEFTVYDVRVCSIIKQFEHLAKTSKIDILIPGYLAFVKAVKNEVPEKSLRDKDRYLWGKSFYEDLQKLVKRKNFD